MAKPTKTTAVEEAKVSLSASGIATIPGVKLDTLTTLIVGTSPLIINKFSHKAIAQMLGKQTGAASAGRSAKDPVADFNGASHFLADGSYGFPAAGLKAAIADACDIKSGLAKTKAKGAIRVLADCEMTNLIRIFGPEGEDQGPANHEYEGFDGPAWPRLRQDLVRNETGVADIRHRPEFSRWCMLLRVQYMKNTASAAQILQAIATAGFSVGLGEWRPKSKQSLSGTFGTFSIADAQQIAAFEAGTLFSIAKKPAALKKAA
jgi:hypothetical protein